MQKLITAAAAVLLLGMGAFSVAYTDAQRGERGPRPERPAQPEPRGNVGERAQPATWQIVPGDRHTFLLNTATGESFRLDGVEGRLFWVPIQGPGKEGRDQPRRGDRPREPRENRERTERRLEELREQLKEARGEARERIERAIEAIERRGEGRPGRDSERADPEQELRQIEERIGNLERRFKESDSVRERERIEEALKEHRAEAERLRNELRQRR